MITLEQVYESFLSRVNADDWDSVGCDKTDIEWMTRDWRSLLDQAIFYFKFPRCSLLIDDFTQTFSDKRMSMDEVAVLATYMKLQWVKRSIDTWENIKTQYEEKDFSQANLLNQFIKLKSQVEQEATDAERIYYRSVKKTPFSYRRLAGKR